MNEITSLPAIIERVASNPEIDIDRLQRLLDMREAEEIRAADKAFSAALTAAESEMETINYNARNDQTRSRYATFAQVDREVRPIYTRHGFGIQFTSEQMGEPNKIMVVGMLSHRAGASRRFQVPMPITTAGFKGTSMMTDTHATMAAITYGRRNLEIMMFNLQVGDDVDGNQPRPAPHIDHNTGEVTEPALNVPHQTPAMIMLGDQEEWSSWGPRFMRPLKTSRNLDELQQWQDLNTSTLIQLKAEKPAAHAGVMAAIDAFRKTLS